MQTCSSLSRLRQDGYLIRAQQWHCGTVSISAANNISEQEESERELLDAAFVRKGNPVLTMPCSDIMFDPVSWAMTEAGILIWFPDFSNRDKTCLIATGSWTSRFQRPPKKTQAAPTGRNRGNTYLSYTLSCPRAAKPNHRRRSADRDMHDYVSSVGSS